MFNFDLAKRKFPICTMEQEMREAYGQTTENSSVTDLKGIPKKKQTEPKADSRYSSFLSKYDDLENSFVRFNTQDLVYFFREKAKEAGVKYVIANMKRDMGIFKRLKDNYEVAEILLMIEFIFSGEQTYLDIHRTQPTVLASSYVNKIYQDSIDWSNDCYTEKKVKKTVASREWKKLKPKDKKGIGEW